jgi:putative addiction module component (TIGR02574 family)
MDLSQFPELKKLPRKQKLQLADELWKSGVGEATPVTREQKKLLASRWSDYRAGKIKRIGLSELERRAAGR